MSSILIENVTILPMDDENKVMEHCDIAIQGNKIVYMGSGSQGPKDFATDTVIDGGGLLALPGLVNCHTHAAMTLMRSYADDLPLMEWLKDKIWPLEAKLEPEDIYWGTLLCCLEMIKSGTTAFADMYFHMDEVAKAVEKAGMRACLARGLVGIGPEAELGLEQSENFIREWHGGADGRITVMLGPHAPYTCPPDYLKRVAAIAEKHAVGIHIHIAESKQEIEDIQKDYSKTPVKLLKDCGIFESPVIGAHCVYVDEKDMAI
ncbi:MAG TPA: amidohydrolase family protein, partial [Clostridia bacterium]|nr:amidohydrolase family protein [Clostridia bacterium]